MADDDLVVAVTTDPDGRTVVVLSGEIDMANAHRLESALDRIDGPTVVVLDDLTYIDTQAVRLLARSGPGTVIVARTDSIARQVLDLGRLSDVLTVVDALPPTH